MGRRRTKNRQNAKGNARTQTSPSAAAPVRPSLEEELQQIHQTFVDQNQHDGANYPTLTTHGTPKDARNLAEPLSIPSNMKYNNTLASFTIRSGNENITHLLLSIGPKESDEKERGPLVSFGIMQDSKDSTSFETALEEILQYLQETYPEFTGKVHEYRKAAEDDTKHPLKHLLERAHHGHTYEGIQYVTSHELGVTDELRAEAAAARTAGLMKNRTRAVAPHSPESPRANTDATNEKLETARSIVQ